jgi:L-histidine Nalpha-methyltransferase
VSNLSQFEPRLESRLESHPSIEARLQIETLLMSQPLMPQPHAGDDVIQGLSQSPKTLPPKYFYDDRGSHLFEQITTLPEYYLTRTETAILTQCAGAIAHITGPCELVELGSGSSVKTRLLLDAYQSVAAPFYYVPIDVSAGILTSSARDLLRDYPQLKVLALASTYDAALVNLAERPRQNRMICFLGSTLGNLNPQECELFLQQVAEALQAGEYFLLGVDLHCDRHKPITQIEAAYNDAQGITAAFNLNILQHLNRRFGANFDLQQFSHWAFYNTEAHQIEMHLNSRIDQIVALPDLGITAQFAAGETIRSEISRKFDREALTAVLQKYQLSPLSTWTDAQDWFAVMLCQKLV